MGKADVHVSIGALKRFSAAVRVGLRHHDGPIGDAFLQWRAIYVGFLRQRFVRLSRGGGGGEWPPLKESTIDRRRHGHRGKHKRGKRARARAVASGGGQVAMLRDTGTLFATLDPTFSGPGKVSRRVPYGITVGIGGPARHPKGKATIADIARAHHTGSGNLPERKLIVEPSGAVKGRMAQILTAAIERLQQGD